MALNVANWSDKQLDELTDLLRTADFSAVAAFISKSFLATGSRIMTDPDQTTLRVTVGSNTTTVQLTAGVFQHNGLISEIDTTQIINILDPAGPGTWGPGQTAVGMGGDRWTTISVKWDEQLHTIDQRWFVDDSVIPNIYTQRPTLTLINKAYYTILVSHSAPGVTNPPTAPPGYFTICEILIKDGVTSLGPAGTKGGFGNIITDTADGQSQAIPTKNWYTTADYPYPSGITGPTRIQRLEFWSTSFGIDHYDSGIYIGHHRPGAWYIGPTAVTATAEDLNQVTGGADLTAPTVNVPNLKKVTDGSTLAIGELHTHYTAPPPSGAYAWSYLASIYVPTTRPYLVQFQCQLFGDEGNTDGYWYQDGSYIEWCRIWMIFIAHGAIHWGSLYTTQSIFTIMSLSGPATHTVGFVITSSSYSISGYRLVVLPIT